MSPWVAVGVSVLALIVACATLAGTILGQRAKAGDRCSRCPHLRWDHRAEGCRRCSCDGFRS